MSRTSNSEIKRPNVNTIETVKSEQTNDNRLGHKTLDNKQHLIESFEMDPNGPKRWTKTKYSYKMPT